MYKTLAIAVFFVLFSLFANSISSPARSTNSISVRSINQPSRSPITVISSANAADNSFLSAQSKTDSANQANTAPSSYDLSDGSIKDSYSDSGISLKASSQTMGATANTPGSNLPNLNSHFIAPAIGYNWGLSEEDNSVNIANVCGTPVVAAADGLVISDKSTPNITDGWNNGYGNFVLLEHPFGTNVMTRYAHLEQVSARVGDYIKQGQQIGLIGETGDTAGCQLYFEVYGAQNPLGKS